MKCRNEMSQGGKGAFDLQDEEQQERRAEMWI